MGTSIKRYYATDSVEKLELENILRKNTSLEKKKQLGQFITPQYLADEITKNTLSYYNSKRKISYLEPAIGSGSFLAALLKRVPKEKIDNVLGVDIDKNYIDVCKRIYTDRLFNFLNTDFTSLDKPTKKYNLIITNPPYIRHQNLRDEVKLDLRQRLNKKFDIKITGYSDIYIYFLILSTEWLMDGGIAAFLIPSTFMETNYGKVIKKFLLDNVTLLQVHTYDNSCNYFTNATVPLSVVTFKKEKPDMNNVIFSYGKSIADPTQAVIKERAHIDYEDKWTNFKNRNTPLKGVKIGDLFTTRRGIATGANSFFILENKKVEHLNLERNALVPILPSPRKLSTDYINRSKDGSPEIQDRYYLINTKLYPEDLREQFPNIYNYLMTQKDEISKRYIPSERKVWYWQEQREPAPILMAYFARKSSKKNSSYRFIRNRSDAIANNSYILLYPKVALSEQDLDYIFDKLFNLSEKNFQSNTRNYGGGLKKIEPKELLKIIIE